MKKTAMNLLAKLLSLLSENNLDRVTRLARDNQHREEDNWYRNKKGQWQRCRLASTDWDDEIMRMSGCAGEFANDFRKKDLRDGCTFCREEVGMNASEPDVMRRWDLA